MRHVTYLLILAFALGCSARDDKPATQAAFPAPAPFPEDADVLAWLEADFQALLAEDPHADAIKQVADQLANASQLEWSAYGDVLAALRRYRSRAAIPLLLKHYIEICGDPRTRDWRRESLPNLITLTGADMTVLRDVRPADIEPASVQAGVARVIREWYIPNYHTITTDIDAMTPPQVWRVTRECLSVQASLSGSISIARASHLLRGPSFAKDYVDFAVDPSHIEWERGGALPEALSAKMVPYLLAAAEAETRWLWRIAEPLPDDREGVLASIAEAGQRHFYREIPAPLNYSVVPLLAELRKAGLAGQLDQVAADPDAAPASRLVCVLAMARAGEGMAAEPLLSLIEQQEDLLFRLPAIAALRHVEPSQVVTAKLLELLDDPERRAVVAAILVLDGNTSPAFVAKLGRILSDGENEAAVGPALNALKQVSTRESAEAVAGFLSTALADPAEPQYLVSCTWAMEAIVGRSFRKRGEDAARRGAQAALTWWQENRETWSPK